MLGFVNGQTKTGHQIVHFTANAHINETQTADTHRVHLSVAFTNAGFSLDSNIKFKIIIKQ